MKKLSTLAVILMLLTSSLLPASANVQSYCYEADNGEAQFTISASGVGVFTNCLVGHLPIDGLTLKKASFSIVGCTVSYTGLANGYTIVSTADTCTGVAVIQVYESGSLIYGFTDTNTSNSVCSCS